MDGTFRLFLTPMAVASIAAILVAYLAKHIGRKTVPFSMLLIWGLAVAAWLVTRDPAAEWLGGPSLTLKWDATFSAAAALVLFVTALPIWYLINKRPLRIVITAAVLVALAVGYLFWPTYYFLICMIGGVCDP